MNVVVKLLIKDYLIFDHQLADQRRKCLLRQCRIQSLSSFLV